MLDRECEEQEKNEEIITVKTLVAMLHNAILSRGKEKRLCRLKDKLTNTLKNNTFLK